MDTGGISPEERRRQTAAEIARKKVVAAYSGSQSGFSAQKSPMISRSYNTGNSVNNSATASTETPVNSAAVTANSTQTYKNANPQTNNKKADSWQQYHTAWQNYYQKYYSEYYAKAAQSYIEGEKNKFVDESEKQKQKIDELERKTQKQKEQLAEAINNASSAEPDQVRVVEKTLRDTIRKKADSKFQVKKKHKKWIPVIAGVSMTLLILFLQYNRVVFAPIMSYISPGNSTDEEIAAIDPTVSEIPAGENKLIIPKLNVDVPVHFGISNDTATVNNAMLHGVAHFRVPGASAYPGQVGNVVISGHSAGEIYSNNQYKFIFSGLERLAEGDLIYINYEKTRYTYRVTGNRKVDPSDVKALAYNGDKPIVTLLTCWPVGVSTYRLLVEGEQINPVPPNGNTTEDEQQPAEDLGEADEAAEMPSNEKTFFEKVWDWLTGNG